MTHCFTAAQSTVSTSLIQFHSKWNGGDQLVNDAYSYNRLILWQSYKHNKGKNIQSHKKTHLKTLLAHPPIDVESHYKVWHNHRSYSVPTGKKNYQNADNSSRYLSYLFLRSPVVCSFIFELWANTVHFWCRLTQVNVDGSLNKFLVCFVP